MRTIFLVTTFQTINDEVPPTFGERRCVGWFDNFNEAENAILNNFEDMHNSMYKYAIIEEMDPGILAVDNINKRCLYKWQNNKYEKIEIPKCLECVSNFGIG